MLNFPLVNPDNQVRDVPLDAIEVGERIRRQFEGIDQLAASLEQQGQMQPIVLDRTPLPNGRHELIAGERRYRATAQLGHPTIEARFVDPSSEVERLLMEYAENAVRQDFTWPEQVQFRAKFHHLQQAKHGEGTKGHGGGGWSLEKTAAALGLSIGPISEDVRLAEALERDPSLANFSSKEKALRELRNKTAITIQDALAARVDPLRAESYVLSGTDTMITSIVLMFVPQIPEHASSLAVPTHVVQGPMAGDAQNPSPFIWHVEGEQTTEQTETHFHHAYAQFDVIYNGNEPYIYSPAPNDIIAAPAVPPTQRIHPDQLPAALYAHFIDALTKPGDLVVDLASRGGTCAVVSIIKDRKCYVFEPNDHLRAATVIRISNALAMKG